MTAMLPDHQAKNNDQGVTRSQSGNVFFIILIGIVMFAALMFTFSRSARQGTESLGSREAELAASDIISYGQRVERGVQRILSKGISESDISFANDIVTGYDNLSCTTEGCLVFSPSGGGVAWANPPDNVNAGEPYFFGTNRVGSFDGTTKQIGTTERDLVIILPVKPEVCTVINNVANKFTTWESGGSPNVTTKFQGNYTTGAGTMIARGNETEQPSTGCFCEGTDPCAASDPHYFYKVLVQR